MINSNIRVLQVNLNRSAEATESALQLAVELKIDLLVIQEPWILPRRLNTNGDYSATRSIAHPSYTQLLPNHLNHLRPRTLTYISKNFKPLVSLAVTSPSDPDIQIINIIEGKSRLQIINVYNEKDQDREKGETIERALYQTTLHPNSIILGDFNAHHTWWDANTSSTLKGEQLAEWFEDHNLVLINEPGVGTFLHALLVLLIMDRLYGGKDKLNSRTLYNHFKILHLERS